MEVSLDARRKRLELIVAGLETRGLKIHRGTGRADVPPVIRLPSSFRNLATALGIGGIPRGLACEFIGPLSSGKATLAAFILAEAQRTGGMGIYVNLSGRLDPDYLQRCGVDLKQLVIVRPSCASEAVQITADLVRSGIADMVVVDSTNQLSDGSLSASALARALERLVCLLSRSPTALIFLTTLSGPRRRAASDRPPASAVSQWAGLRLLILREQWLREEDDVVGYRAGVAVVKSKGAAPQARSVPIELRFGGIGL